MPGAEICGAPANSLAIASANARPIQSVDGSGPRFSKRRIASRWTPGSGRRAQPASSRTVPAIAPAHRRLKDTLLPGHQLLKLRQLLDSREVRLVFQLLFILEPFFERFPQILNRQIVAPRLGVELRHVEMELGALFHAPLFKQDARAAVVLEDVRVQPHRGLVVRGGPLILFPRE